MAIYSDDTVGKLPVKYAKYYNIERLREELKNTGWDAKEIEIYDSLYTTLEQGEVSIPLLVDGVEEIKTFKCKRVKSLGPKFLQMRLTKVKHGGGVIIMPYRESPNVLAKMLTRAEGVCKTPTGTFQHMTYAMLVVKILSAVMGVGCNDEVWAFGKVMFEYVKKVLNKDDKMMKEYLNEHLSTTIVLSSFLRRNVFNLSEVETEWFTSYPSFRFVYNLYLPTKFTYMEHNKMVRDRT